MQLYIDDYEHIHLPPAPSGDWKTPPGVAVTDLYMRRLRSVGLGSQKTNTLDPSALAQQAGCGHGAPSGGRPIGPPPGG